MPPRSADTTPPFAARFAKLDAARPVHEHRIAAFGPWLNRGDPLADAAAETLSAMDVEAARALVGRALDHGIDSVPQAPETLRALFAELDRPPLWVDFAQLERGGAVFLRAGAMSQLALYAASLPLAYTSPAGVKPLVFTGQLVERALPRLAETARFVFDVCAPGALRRDGIGFKSAVRVRLAHAQVRRLLLRSKRWDAEKWGSPLNAADMVATNLCFSIVVLDVLRRLGFHITPEETDDVMQLWRYTGHLVGIPPELTIATETEGLRLQKLVLETQEGPDDDCVALMRALLDLPLHMAKTDAERAQSRHAIAAAEGIVRWAIGDAFADALRIPNTSWRHAVKGLRAGVVGWETARRVLPGGDALAIRAGRAMWRRSLEDGFGIVEAHYDLSFDALAREVAAGG